MSVLFDLYIWPYTVLMQLDVLSSNLIVGVMITAKLALGGWMLARAGRSPLWILALLVPWLDLLAVWLFAYAAWPAEGGAHEAPPSASECSPHHQHTS